MYEIAIPGLAFLAVMLMGGAVMAARTGRKERVRVRLERGFDDDQVQTTQTHRRMLDLLKNVGNSVSFGNHSRALKETLSRTGYHGGAATAVYLGAKIILLTAGFIGLPIVLIPTPLTFHIKGILVLLGAATLFFIPNVVIHIRRQKRRRDVRHHLPDAVDLLEVCVSSGMGLDMAWNMVSQEIRRVCPTLADEMALTNLEIHLGASRVEAMRHLAERTGADEIGSLVAVLVQSDRFGTSIASALQTFASGMRMERSAHAQEVAEKTAVKLLFPMVLFIFPSMLIVIVGPAGIKFAQLMLNG
ncbi:MAG: type II secretion system F family protein [Planctomycetota bacterium]|jgi:tight adherence protein C